MCGCSGKSKVMSMSSIHPVVANYPTMRQLGRAPLTPQRYIGSLLTLDRLNPAGFSPLTETDSASDSDLSYRAQIVGYDANGVAIYRDR
jgi:hypothetical protein